ncbi:ABC transporter substrate-binding protein [Paenibacillus sp. OV219]|uniref:ABC transporter substrate-binding protein n=1 Tax=Paenibacillus sp. OV219 TaxID=1884377 RepID=UPI0008D634B3|nr:ABC transporter substrate-binding protein [Paenibacillus sp. OV219]SEP17073.1 carbohydrate ABC transporter substrate-binding protein, CUT1 family [Paenibacillus sp. OV219]
MKKFRKAFFGLSIVAMAALVLAGCGSSNNDASGSNNTGTGAANSTDSKPSADVVKLTAVFPGQASTAAPDVLKAINEKLKADGLNIEVDIKYIDDYWNKLALNIAGGTQYDLAWAHSSTLSDLVAKKVYQPIDDALKSDGPDLLTNTPDYVLKGGAINGKQYAIARAIPMTGFNNVFDIRGDLREKYGISKITTLDGLESYFQAVMKNDPSMYAFVGPNTQALFPIYANYYYPIGDGGMYPVYIDPADSTHTVKSFLDTQAFADIVNKKKEWKDKGIISADASKLDDAEAGFDNGKVAALGANIFRASERVDTLTKIVPGAKVETVYLEPSKRYIFSAGDNMLAVPSTSKHVKEAVQLMNWIKKDQANFDLWSYGVEGKNYKLVDGSVDTSSIAEVDKYNTNVWMWNDLRLARFSTNYAKSDIDELKTWDSKSEVSPFVGFTLDTSKIKSQISQLQAVMSEYGDNLGLGVTDYNSVKDEIMKKMKAAGLQDVIDETQKQVNAYLAAK